MNIAILEVSGDSINYIFSEDGFTMFVLSQPILATAKGRMLKDIEHLKDIVYNEKRYVKMEGPETLIIKRASNITLFGQSSYSLGERSIHLIEADERKDMEIEYDIPIKAEDIISCKTELMTTFVVAKSHIKTGYAYLRTNINNLKLL